MLIYPKSIAGVTLIELMIAVAILGILLVAGLPQASTWMQNTRLRTSAESISAGLQLARSEAVRRNVQVEFVLTNNTPDAASMPTLVTNTNGPSWVVRIYQAPNPYTAADFIQGRLESSPNIAITSGAGNIVFNTLGRTTLGAANTIQVTNPTGGACIAAGPMRCLNILVQTGGQIRMCDPSITTAGDTRKC